MPRSNIRWAVAVAESSLVSLETGGAAAMLLSSPVDREWEGRLCAGFTEVPSLTSTHDNSIL